MGFYIEMMETKPHSGYFQEKEMPSVFWILYGIALFAILCMGTAAFTVLKDLIIKGDTLDHILLALTLSFIPLLLIIGIKLAFLRKFIDFSENLLITGFALPNHKTVLFKKVFSKNEISEFFLINKRQSANLAKKAHSDERYHIRGHWKILVEVKNKRFVLDRHTEKECLEPLYNELNVWLKRPTSSCS